MSPRGRQAELNPIKEQAGPPPQKVTSPKIAKPQKHGGLKIEPPKQEGGPAPRGRPLAQGKHSPRSAKSNGGH